MNGYKIKFFHFSKIWLIAFFMGVISLPSFAQSQCEEKSVRLLNDWGDRNQFTFTPTSHNVQGAVVESGCVVLNELEEELTATTQRGSLISLNGSDFSNGPIRVRNRDKIELMFSTPNKIGESVTDRLILTKAETNSHWYYPWTISTVESETLPESCFEANFTFDEKRQRLRVFELPPSKYQKPSSQIISRCIKVTNLPQPVLASMQRDGEFSINNEPYSTSTRIISNGDIITLRKNASNVKGDVLLDRLTLQQELDSGEISTTYYQWFVANESNNSFDHISDCYALYKHSANSTILPHTVVSDESPRAISQCVVNAEPQSTLTLKSLQKHSQVFVNNNLTTDELIELNYGDRLHFEYSFSVPSFSYSWFNYQTIWEDGSVSASNIKWIIENNITTYNDSLPVNSSVPSYQVDVSMFENCRSSSFHLRVNDSRFFAAAALPSNLYQPLNTEIYSNCIQFEGLEAPMKLKSHNNSFFSINSQPFSNEETLVTNGDKLVFATTTPNDFNSSKTIRAQVIPGEGAIDDRVFFLNWSIQTTNTERAPKTWKIGPNQNYREMDDIAHQLIAGDVVEVQGDADYKPFILFNTSGTPSLPIKIVGTTVNNKRPKFIGNHKDWKWTIAVRNSHSIELENLEVTGGDNICIRHESDNLKIINSYIHNCPHIGIMGTDSNSGSISILDTEVTNSGGLPDPSQKWGHPIYVATDQFRFPGSVLRVENSFLHNNRGNSIKSRAENTKLYYNWIEVSDIEQSRYAIELIGPEMRSVGVMDQDVVGNSIVMNKDFAVARFGNDGSGGSNGRVRFANNLFVINADSYNTYLFNLTYAMTSFTLQNNLIHSLDNNVDIRYLLRDDVNPGNWEQDYVGIFIENNTFPNIMRLKSSNLPDTAGSTSEHILGTERWSNNDYAQDVISTSVHNGLVEQIWGYQENTMPYQLNVPDYLILDEYLVGAPVDKMRLSRPIPGESIH